MRHDDGGSTWSTQSSSTTLDLNAVAFAPGYLQGFAAGDNGIVDKYFGCTAGSLSLTSPSSLTFGAVTLDGTDQTTTAFADLSVTDETGSQSGWSVSAYATPFSDAQGHTLPAPLVSAATAASATGTCTLPANTVGFPTTLGATSGTAAKVVAANAGTGAGPANLSLTLSIPIPGNQRTSSPGRNTFNSTVTFTVASGP